MDNTRATLIGVSHFLSEFTAEQCLSVRGESRHLFPISSSCLAWLVSKQCTGRVPQYLLNSSPIRLIQSSVNEINSKKKLPAEQLRLFRTLNVHCQCSVLSSQIAHIVYYSEALIGW